MNPANNLQSSLDSFIRNLCIQPTKVTNTPLVAVEFSRENKAAVISIMPDGYIISLATDTKQKVHRAQSSSHAANLVERFLLTQAGI